MLRKFFIVLLLACCGAALLAGCGGDPAASASDKERGGEKGEKEAPREVRVTQAETASLSRTIAVSGALAADEEAQLGLKVPGRIQAVLVDLGDHVQRGQVLARLMPTDYELQIIQAQTALDQARARLGLAPGDPKTVLAPEQTAVVKQAAANLKQAQVTRDRVASLFSQELVPRSDLDAAEAAFQVADGRYQEAIEDARGRQYLLAQRTSELEIARQRLADSRLAAPFDGMIRERLAGVGDYVAAGQPVVVLVRVHPLRLRLAIPEREAASVRTGQAVRLHVEGDPATHQGRVARISPSISEDNRTLLVEAEVPNPNGRLRPGAFARAEIVTQAGEPALLVPKAAVVTFAGIEKVMSVEAGKVVEKRVRTGRRSGDRVEILEGVEAGDPVILEPGNLVGGQAVQPVQIAE